MFKAISQAPRWPAIGATLLIAVSTLSSCVTRDPRLVSALQRSSVAEIRVDTAPDVRMSGLFAGGKPDPQLSAVVRTLRETMNKELKGLPGGPVRVRLVATLHTVDVSSKAGRVIVSSDSIIEGTVRLEDAATGQLIAEAQNVRAADRAVRGGGLGIVVAMAVNAAAASGGDDALAARLSSSFTRQVKDWLTQK